jgi:hypothetical protein
MRLMVAPLLVVGFSLSASAQSGVVAPHDASRNLVRDGSPDSSRGINRGPVNNGPIRTTPIGRPPPMQVTTGPLIVSKLALRPISQW